MSVLNLVLNHNVILKKNTKFLLKISYIYNLRMLIFSKIINISLYLGNFTQWRTHIFTSGTANFEF